jgi:hypothetical protein
VFSQFASASGYTCEGAGTAFMPYLLSTLDTLAWRYNVPEAFYPEALIPGRREIGTRTGLNLGQRLSARRLPAPDRRHKSGAVVAQRAGDIVTRRNQIHVYQPLLANARDGYWPAGALMETDASTGKWQELTPTLSNSCAVFPHSRTRVQAQQGDYAWALWRPYACCRRRARSSSAASISSEEPTMNASLPVPHRAPSPCGPRARAPSRWRRRRLGADPHRPQWLASAAASSATTCSTASAAAGPCRWAVPATCRASAWASAGTAT